MLSETPIAQKIRLNAAYSGVYLWRNNNGAFQDDTGRWVRYGLGNDSKQMSEQFKSSDYVGIRPVIITPDMVGSLFGIFTAVETKKENWNINKKLDNREQAQLRFINLVRKNGGLAGFANSVQAFREICRLP